MDMENSSDVSSLFPTSPQLHFQDSWQNSTTAINGIHDDVLRYLCESDDAVLNLTTVEYFANVSMSDMWPEMDLHTAAKIFFIGEY